MVDLELLHNFSTRTHATLSECPVVRDFYRVTAVEYGFQQEYIMRALLAVSACHMAFHRPEQRDHYQGLAMSYHQIATKSASEPYQPWLPPFPGRGRARARSLTMYGRQWS